MLVRACVCVCACVRACVVRWVHACARARVLVNAARYLCQICNRASVDSGDL